MKRILSLTSAFTLIILLTQFVFASEIPRLEKRGRAMQLLVDGQPFLILGGELHNSSSSSLEYTKPIFPGLADMNLNTVLVPVSWGLIEPEEGEFDFSLVDGIIRQARDSDLRLILLWFGSWKNGLSHYVPDWVKEDYQRFPRVQTKTGPVEVLSPFEASNRQADARAFAALMQHLRDVDGDRHTVLMVQVENEVGLLGDSRDRSVAAQEAWQKPVPQPLLDYLATHQESLLSPVKETWQAQGYQISGTWEEVFGKGPQADEIFMAWHYARYINNVANAGKEEYPLPMLVNAWIVQPQDELPGDYPTGGPQAHNFDLWRAGAPQIDLIAPDIYLPNFGEVCAQFTRPDNPLLVPESVAGDKGAANLLVALGQYNAIGYSPFGIDSRLERQADGPIAKVYGLLQEMAPMILEHQAKGSIAGVYVTKDNPDRKIFMGDYVLTAGLVTSWFSDDTPEQGSGLIMQTAHDEFLAVGANLQITFASRNNGQQTVGLATAEEGHFRDGKWVKGRTLNGDAVMISYDMESLAARHQTGTGLKFRGKTPTILKVKLYDFK